MGTKRVAIVGGGYSGLAAFWALKDSDYDVHLFEASDQIGSLMNYAPFEIDGREVQINTAVNVFNPSTSPNLLAFLRELGIPHTTREFSFSSSQIDGSFEWSFRSIYYTLLQVRSLMRQDTLWMLFDVTRFNHFALDVLRVDMATGPVQTVREYLAAQGYCDTFRDNYIVPLMTIFWNIHRLDDALDVPMASLVRFLWDNDMLQRFTMWPRWSTVNAGPGDFEEAGRKAVSQGTINLNARVESVKSGSQGDQLFLQLTSDRVEIFDHVILATSGQDAFNIMALEGTDEEIQLLGEFLSTRVVSILHSDVSLMPKKKSTWAAFNHLASPLQNSFSISYFANLLQGFPSWLFCPMFITPNPLTPPHPASLQGISEYSCPVFNAKSLYAQRRLSQIQNTRGISYCGPWTGFGLYEDGIRSAFEVAVKHLGAQLPFEVVPASANNRPIPPLTPEDMRARRWLQLPFRRKSKRLVIPEQRCGTQISAVGIE
ncbi:hypothetical protein AJ80_00976 [Polytolypa hystricis UAMH7299]|uniref:Amine oxidase domain-containing protein n=1 Tax=Polytolypa hystricis (strain UAMH7299) TaxID=1447883 RepID=A0A2B7Z005_POLH7|nr:hypothetical protein AJ80_00976 [Polytolypa hystricis UAMH7299]